MTRVCPSCGTEVDDDALFCPTCGQPMQEGARPELPPAPDWPEPPREPAGSRAETSKESVETSAEAARPQPASAERPPTEAGQATGWDDASEGSAPAFLTREPDQSEAANAAPADAAAVNAAPADAAAVNAAAAEASAASRYHAELGPHRQDAQEVPPWRRGATHAGGSLPAPPAPLDETAPQRAAQPPPLAADSVTLPEMLSAWLSGIGAFVALVALLLPWRTGGSYTAAWGLASGANVGVGILLLGVVATVFFARLVPSLPRRDLAVATLGTLGVGIGLDRLALPLTAAGATIFLLGMLAVAVGGFLALLGYDRRVGGQPS
jgi:zinc-ribbon domain